MKIAQIAALMTLGLFAAHAGAHSTVHSTTPASGSVLPATPAKITIEFNEAARLATVVVAVANGAERKLEFTPQASAKTFTIAEPKLAPGRNEVRWTALSKDGHPISGIIILVIKPPSAGDH